MYSRQQVSCVLLLPSASAGSSPELVLNQMLKHTAVQARFSCNMVALVGATPKTLNLKEFLAHFLEFRWGQGGEGMAACWCERGVFGCVLCVC